MELSGAGRVQGCGHVCEGCVHVHVHVRVGGGGRDDCCGGVQLTNDALLSTPYECMAHPINA